MAASQICKVAVFALILVALSGCEEGQNPLAALSAGGTAEDGSVQDPGTGAAGAAVERDVESPQVFSASDRGLWDGRPSLGGIWVAHPDVTSPERVVIRNTANGRETIGALFRREREMPGPRIQVSSDAAAALGMVAGAPVDLNVVALVRERAAPAPTATEALPSGGIEATSLEPGAPAAAPAPARAPDAGDRPASRPPRAAAAAPAAAPTPAPAAIPTPTPAPPATPSPAPSPETTAPAAAAPATPPAAAAPAPAPAAPAATQAPLAGGSFIQVGIFSQESNAEGTAKTLRDAGIVPAVRQQESNGRTVWRVLVGPVTTASDRATLLERVRDLGFADAYVIRN